MATSMESEMDFSLSFTEFENDLKTAQQNLILFAEIQNSFKSGENMLRSDVSQFNTIKGTVQNLGDILRKFNSDVDIVFAHFNDHNTAQAYFFTSDEKSQNVADNKCQITHIVDAQQRLCYAIDVNGEILRQLKRFWKYSSVQELETNESLRLNDVFGIEIDMNMHRGRFVFDTTKNSVRIRLIDTGEIIDAGDYGFKKLPDDIKSIPPCAILCRIERIGPDEVESLPESVKGQIFDYRIRKIDESNHIFNIDVFSKNPFLLGFADDTNWKAFNEFGGGELEPSGDTDVSWNLEQTINKTLQSKWNVTMGNRLKKSQLPTPIYNSNYDLNDNTSSDFQSVENRNAIASNASSFIDANGAAALDTTNNDYDYDGDVDGNNGEKSISIKNRLGDPPSKSWCLNPNKRQANIMNDSSRAHCLNNGGRQWQKQQYHQHCHQNSFTSSKSAFESVRPMKTQCETYLLQSHHNQLKTPRVGEPTTIIPTCVLNATEFYGQLGRHFSGFHYFQQRLNIRRSHFEYEQYSQMPGNAELVLVLLENGLFHRAKVLSGADDQATVFLLDYGTTHRVSLHHIHKWTPHCDKHSFQAILFTLSNVKVQHSIVNSHITNLVNEKIPKTFVSAEITNVDGRSISVRLFDDSGFDIGEEINCIVDCISA
ncbi:uncharacterized protein LOC129575613 [Sitodiplosis mosellana]|uniref:uncharacterized protein LOC129575613 n=1 Tax=Sitodiplosis mosellana TaxID=263140 RepID=UPI002444238E|nr:uncharacterized protein LOC129575613 [Sitodiplosis mosellana]